MEDYQNLLAIERDSDVAARNTVDSPRDSCGIVFNAIFYLLCYLSGQLMLHVDMNWPRNCFRLAFLGWIVFFFIFFCLNIGSLVFDFYAVIKCPFPNCGFIAGPYMESKHVSNVTELTYPFTRGISKPYFSYQDAVITIATVSGSLSYLTMMFRVLLVNYSWIHKSVKSLIMNMRHSTKQSIESY